jgi:uroporphyrin-III C-methyltransferase
MTAYLVGAGPGDPGLLTARALELIASADVILYDRLIPPEALAHARPEAELIDVGKVGGGRQVPQDVTTALLVEHAAAGREVVRLKGGDPFVFGRGGEEALALAEAGISFEIVPGISSLAAVPAAAGIPVTHRGVSDRVTIATGHAADGSPPDYAALARAGGTLVLFMGLGRLRELADGLVREGLAAETPAGVISRGTLPDQEVVTGTLAGIADAAHGLPGPALVVVGDVVALAERLRRRSRATAAVA